MADEDQDRVINHCPECGEAIDVTDQPPFAKILCPHCDEAVRVRTVLGNFQISRLLGEGGMSQVFLAEDLTLDRKIALKVLHRDLSQDATLMAQFEREAQLTASINHPNVVKVYKAGSEQGYFFIAMELVDRISLEEHIAAEGTLDESEVLGIAYDVASGLRAAHVGGLIHRDIKPGNILLTEDGTAKLVDFGLALIHGDEDHIEDLWATPFYVPPEKLDGEPDDFRGDIYSLGATFFHALAGHPPFQANTASMEELKTIKAQPVALHDHADKVSAMTASLIDRMMAYKPDDRPQSYDELLKLIAEEQDRQPDSEAAKTRRKRIAAANAAAAATPAAGPNWALFAGVGVAVLAVAGVAFAVFGGGGNNNAPLITNEERVLSAGEKAVTARFNEARTNLLRGQHAEAEAAFASLLETREMIQPTRSWARFNAGLAALLDGKEASSARSHFSLLAQANGFNRSNPEAKEEAAFFERIGTLLADPLPIMPENGARLKTNTDQSVALLAFGLKNWNQGQFASAMSFFDAFEQAKPNHSWVKDYRKLLLPYQADYAAIEDLPNPRLSMSAAELAEVRAALEAARSKIRTPGIAQKFVRSRIKRVGTLLEAKKTLASTPPIPPTPVAVKTPTPDPSPSPGSDPASAAMTPEAQAEKAKLAETLLGMQEMAADYRFSEVTDRLNELSFQSEPIQQLHQDSIAACKGAEAFVSRLIETLSSGSYQGIVRRKAGTPLDAKITGASREQVVIDLGFGPNDLEVTQLAPDWLLEVAVNSWLNPESTPPETDKEIWAEAAWFAGMTGQQEQAGQFAEQILEEAPTFSERWSRLKGL